MKKKMSIVLGFPENVLVTMDPPHQVLQIDTWLSVPAVYAVPFGYKGDPNLIENWAKEVWVRLLPEQITDLSFEAGNVSITFTPDSGIVPATTDAPNQIEVVFQGFDTTTISGNRTATQIVIPQSFIYSVDVTRVTVPPGFIQPVPFTSPTGATDPQPNPDIIRPVPIPAAPGSQMNLIQGQIGASVQDPQPNWRGLW